jgi:hypothetical protein
MVKAALATALLEKPLAVANATSVSEDATEMGPVYTGELVVGVVPFIV